MESEIRNRRVKPRRPNVKQKPETLEELERQIGFQREMIARSTRIVQGLKDNVGWEAFLDNQKEKMEGIDSSLDGFATLTDKGRDYLLSERLQTRSLLTTVEDHERIIEMVTEELNTNIADMNERKQRLRTAQG